MRHARFWCRVDVYLSFARAIRVSLFTLFLSLGRALGLSYLVYYNDGNSKQLVLLVVVLEYFVI